MATSRTGRLPSSIDSCILDAGRTAEGTSTTHCRRCLRTGADPSSCRRASSNSSASCKRSKPTLAATALTRRRSATASAAQCGSARAGRCPATPTRRVAGLPAGQARSSNMWKRVCRMRRRGAILFGRARPGNHCYAMKVPTLRARLATEVRGSRDFAANCLRSCGADPVRLTCKRGCFRFRENSTINKTMQKANPSRLAFLLWRTMYGIVRSSRLLLICPFLV